MSSEHDEEIPEYDEESFKADEKLLQKMIAMMNAPSASPNERETARKKSQTVRKRINAYLEKSDEERIARSHTDRRWETREGEIMEVDDMEDRHVLLAHLFLKRWMRTEGRPVVKADIKRWAELFRSECNKRGIEISKPHGAL